MQELIDCRIEKDPACESAGFDDGSTSLLQQALQVKRLPNLWKERLMKYRG